MAGGDNHCQPGTARHLGNGAHADGSAAASDAEGACWLQAARIRQDHPRWVVIWLSRERSYRAYPKFRARRGTVVSADGPEELIAQMKQVELSAGR